MAALKLKVQVEGHKALMKALKTHYTLVPPMYDAYNRIGQIGVEAGRAAAPVASGRLRSSLKHRVLGTNVASAVTIRTTATRSSARRKRYPYPKRLEYDPKSRHKGWLSNAIKANWGRIEVVLRMTERLIEARFNGA